MKRDSGGNRSRVKRRTDMTSKKDRGSASAKRDAPRRRYRIASLGFASALILIGFIALISPKPAVSDIENRALAEKPTLSFETLKDGSYTRELAIYYSDTFPFRESLIKGAAWFRGLFGLAGEDDVTLHQGVSTAEGADNAFPEKPTDANLEKPVPVFDMEPREQVDNRFNEDYTVDRGGVIVVGNTALELYGFSEEPNLAYAAAVNRFHARYQGRVKTNVMVVPTNVEFKIPDKYKGMSADQYEAIRFIYEQIDSRVNKVQVYNALAAHSGEYIYFRTDHHWTALGAYYAYCKFMETKSLKPATLGNFTEVRLDGFLGSLYNAIGGNPALGAEPDYVIAYQPGYACTVEGYETADPASIIGGLKLVRGPEEIPGKNKYLAFGGDLAYTKITTPNQTGRRIIIFKESFANAMIPFLTANYDEIHLVDFRYYNGDIDSLISENRINEALFLNYVSSAGSARQVERLSALVGE